jgi:hypothetical protein
MVGRKANDSTGSIGKSRTKQGFVFFYSTGCAGHQCGKVIVENEDIFVIRIAQSASAFIACAYITIGIMRWPDGVVGPILLPLPWPFGPMRGYQNPFIFQWVETTVGLLMQRHRAVSNQSAGTRF